MPDVVRILLFKMAFAAALWALSPGPSIAQEDEEDQEPASEQVAETEDMEEIVVISPRPGSRRQLDDEYDPIREELLREFNRLQELDEEYAWREAAETDATSRIQWGYDPREDYRMRNDTALQDLSWEKTKPATLFRFEF